MGWKLAQNLVRVSRDVGAATVGFFSNKSHFTTVGSLKAFRKLSHSYSLHTINI